MLDASSFSGPDLHFAHDGKSVAYVTREKGVDNLWVQPLDGSAGHPVTDFKSEQIWSFSRRRTERASPSYAGTGIPDVVLLQESKP